KRFAWCQSHGEDIKRVFREYSQRKAGRHLLDYDDLLFFLDQALSLSGVGAAIADRFQHVLVDEYQDTNPIQAAILRHLWAKMISSSRTAVDGPTAANRSIMVVGDDAQSIYSFRGAAVENILRFPEQFLGSVTITLDQNYRSVTPLLDAA